jgi:hypothetical protein
MRTSSVFCPKSYACRQNYLLGAAFRNASLAILISALSALYQMTYAGFFVHLSSIPPVLRWLQWICPLKYTLEALVVNEVSSGLMIEDSLDGVPVDVSAVLIMQTVRILLMALCDPCLTESSLAIRIWPAQLLSRRARPCCIHCRVWGTSDRYCMAQST